MLHERLRDGDTSFGISQGEYARRHAKQQRQKARARRQRHIEEMRSRAANAPHERTGRLVEIVQLPDGSRTYVAGYQTAPNPRGSWHPPVQHPITLPFFSILAVSSDRKPRDGE